MTDPDLSNPLPFGTTMVIVTAFDPSGNTDTCMFYVTVIGDEQAPLYLASDAPFDGGITESQLDPGTGGLATSISHNAQIGDTGLNMQELAVISFDTSAIPADAVISGAMIQLTLVNTRGEQDGLGMVVTDLAAPAFGERELEASDFEAAADIVGATVPTVAPENIYDAFRLHLTLDALETLNRDGLTQFRVRYENPTDGDEISDGILISMGEYGDSHPWTPNLIISWSSATCVGCPTDQPADPGTADTELALTSVRAHDGYLQESHETSEVGGFADGISRNILIGDTSSRQQLIALLSFDTSQVPAGAHIVSAELIMTRSSARGNPAEPDAPLGNMLVDMLCPVDSDSIYGDVPEPEVTDFQAFSDLVDMTEAPLTYPTANGRTANGFLTETGVEALNRDGVTQMKVRFQVPDNDNDRADYLMFYSGDIRAPLLRPTLKIVYRED